MTRKSHLCMTCGSAILTLLALVAAAGPVTLPHSFQSGTPARASEVNGNFEAVAAEVNDNDERIAAMETEMADDDSRFSALENGVADQETRVAMLEDAVNAPDVTPQGNLVLGPSTASSGNVMKGQSLFIHTPGTRNTFIGIDAGNQTLTGGYNTAIGERALPAVTEGHNNTAVGASALRFNSTGEFNTALGEGALGQNTTGSSNTALGAWALVRNESGQVNTAVGVAALQNNTTGASNVAIGSQAGNALVDGRENVAIGSAALYSARSSSGNIAIGTGAAIDVQGPGGNNIHIGNYGEAQDTFTIRVGQQHTRTFVAGIYGRTLVSPVAVYIDSAGQLGTMSSSRRFKEDIEDMRDAGDLLERLRPVTFRYKADEVGNDPAPLQYGLIAEEVAEVAPQFVARGTNGEIDTVLYQFLPPLLLDAYQEQRLTIEAQKADVEDLRRQLAALRDEVRRLVAARNP